MKNFEDAGSEKSSESRRVVKSEELFRGYSEVHIEHKKNLYRLMITKAGKLILNK